MGPRRAQRRPEAAALRRSRGSELEECLDVQKLASSWADPSRWALVVRGAWSRERVIHNLEGRVALMGLCRIFRSSQIPKPPPKPTPPQNAKKQAMSPIGPAGFGSACIVLDIGSTPHPRHCPSTWGMRHTCPWCLVASTDNVQHQFVPPSEPSAGLSACAVLPHRVFPNSGTIHVVAHGSPDDFLYKSLFGQRLACNRMYAPQVAVPLGRARHLQMMTKRIRTCHESHRFSEGCDIIPSGVVPQIAPVRSDYDRIMRGIWAPS